MCIPTRGNLFLPVRLLVWADGRGAVAQAYSAAREELQGAHKSIVARSESGVAHSGSERATMVLYKSIAARSADILPNLVG
jgi:hypothetical protein